MQQLDSASLLEILSCVGAGDARDLAKCRCVCKRWSELGWAATGLSFSFNAADSDQLKDKEAILSDVLQRTKQAAPGCLKSLKVKFTCRKPSEAAGQWLVYAADSVVDLYLALLLDQRQPPPPPPSQESQENQEQQENLQEPLPEQQQENQQENPEIHEEQQEHLWGPAMWSSLWCFHALESLTIGGDFDIGHLLPVANASPFTSLTSCYLWRCGAAATSEMIQALCAACPLLKNLTVEGFPDVEPVEVASESLELFGLLADGYIRWTAAPMRVCLRTPRLATLKIGEFGTEGVEVRVVSAEVTDLQAHCSCFFRCENNKQQFDKLEWLYVNGFWMRHALVALLKLAPKVTCLTIGDVVMAGGVVIPIGQALSTFTNLKEINFHTLKPLEADDTKLALETVTAHVWVPLTELREDRQLAIVKQLLVACRVRLFVVHVHLLDFLQRTPMGQKWGDMLHAFPGRITWERMPVKVTHVYADE